jgi:hypothetical protein
VVEAEQLAEFLITVSGFPSHRDRRIDRTGVLLDDSNHLCASMPRAFFLLTLKEGKFVVRWVILVFPVLLME